MDIPKLVNDLNTQSGRPSCKNLTILFYGLNEAHIHLPAGDICAAGGLRNYLEDIWGTEATAEVLNRDWEVIDTDDELTSHFHGSYDTFDWKGYEEALEAFDNGGLDIETFCAGLECEIKPEYINDAYIGYHCNDVSFVMSYYEDLVMDSIPEKYKSYFNWDDYARDVMLDSNHVSYNHNYFNKP